jgi:hypothetical protein
MVAGQRGWLPGNGEHTYHVQHGFGAGSNPHVVRDLGIHTLGLLPKDLRGHVTGQNVGGTLWYILYWKLRWKDRPHFAACGTFSAFCMVTET